MPTGYTATLMEKGQDFRSFVLTCARGMGACIMQRDEGMDVPPRKREVGDYYVKALADAEKKLKRLQAMTPKKQHDYGEEQRLEARSSTLQALARDREENARLDKMATKVAAWEPPTSEHKGLKDFMLEQIKISRHDTSYSEGRVREVEGQTPESYFIEAMSRAVRDIAYYKDELKKETQRAEQANGWIEDLYSSLPK